MGASRACGGAPCNLASPMFECAARQRTHNIGGDELNRKLLIAWVALGVVVVFMMKESG